MSETMNHEKHEKMGKGLMPRLRFPEFRDAGEWGESSLGPMTTKVGSGITPRGGDKNYRKDGRIFVRSQNVGWGVLILDDVAYIDEETHSSFDSTEIKINDVLLNITGASIGRSAVADSRLTGGNVNQHVCIIRTKPNGLHPFLLNQYLISEYGQAQIDSFQAGGNRQGLNFGQIRSFVIPMPPAGPKGDELAEQQKIADCLSSLDGLIAADSRMLEALKAHKKGLMQQLFPQPGQTQPRLRFPEFRDKGEWNENTLSKLSTIIRGGSPRPINSYLTKNPSGLNWLKIGDVDKDAKYVYSTEKKVIPEALSKTREVKPGDFILSNSMSFGRPYLLKMRTCIHDGWIAVTNIAEAIHHEYLYYAIMSPRSQVFFKDQAAGGGVRNLNKGIIKSLPVGYPKITEQQKIASCLTSLDTRIAAQAAKIETLGQHKRGLMQQLFPAPEEQ